MSERPRWVQAEAEESWSELCSALFVRQSLAARTNRTMI